MRGLTGVGVIDGLAVRCLTPDGDVLALCERFGVPVPEPYR